MASSQISRSGIGWLGKPLEGRRNPLPLIVPQRKSRMMVNYTPSSVLWAPLQGPSRISPVTCAAQGSKGSYLDMWQAAVERKRVEDQQTMNMNLLLQQGSGAGTSEETSSEEKSSRLEQQFLQMLEVPEEERQRAHEQQAVDRAAAALAAAQSLLTEVEQKARLQRQLDRGRALGTQGQGAAAQAAPRKSSLSFTRNRKAPSDALPLLQSGSTFSEGEGSAAATTSKSNSGRRTAVINPVAGGPVTVISGNASDPVRAGAGLAESGRTADSVRGGGVGVSGSGSHASDPFTDSGASIGGGSGTRGPDFWSWVPPSATQVSGPATVPPEFLLQRETSRARLAAPVLELDRDPMGGATLDLPFENLQGAARLAGATGQAVVDLEALLQTSSFTLPPLQSRVQTEDALGSATAHPDAATVETTLVDLKTLSPVSEHAVAVEPAIEVHSTPADLSSPALERTGAPAAGQEEGVMPDGSRWWRTTGRDVGALGEVCEWTVVRGVSADGSVEWEEKWWEAWDAFDYKEMGAEKSGRDSNGGVWRETWQESMWQDKKNGLPHMEKSADKWGKDGRGGEWQEKWWEHYDAAGRAEKWADKWSKIDPSSHLEEGHAHAWHEKWGEEFDGKGAASKYCDKWAERCVDVEGNVWTKWGDKWDESFNRDAQGYRRGETWWQGTGDESWNRTWSEGHNNSGWVHKQGQSSSGEHWDVHEPMDTWYERKPHYGFKECLRQSQRLQKVGKKKKVL